jgi:NTE family protein
VHQRLGIALGSGGARGIAHLAMLEVLDDLGWRPSMIAGTSVGAIVGAIYASGMSAAEFRTRIVDMSVAEDETGMALLFNEGFRKWLDYASLDFRRKSLLDVDAFLRDMGVDINGKHFEDLDIPLKVVASDFWRREQVVFDSGELMPAIEASMALPGVFRPVKIGNRVLIDGGAVNPVPYDLLFDVCDVVVAIDVMGERLPHSDELPGLGENVLNTFQIMQKTILHEKLAARKPDIYIQPPVSEVRVLEFYKAERVLRQSREGAEQLRAELEKVLAGEVALSRADGSRP